MARFVSALALLLAIAACGADGTAPKSADLGRYLDGETVFPAGSWTAMQDPAEAGWSRDGLAAAEQTWLALDSAALMVVHRGVVVVSWGEVAERYTAQSVRKSLLNALIGTEVAAGRLRLEASLADLGIDDEPALSPAERQATVRQLLQSRSGVYHSAIYEHGAWKRLKPARGAHDPGEAWFYNNWGFNVLGSIFEDSAGVTVGEAFARRVAEPIGMQDFRPSDVLVLTRSTLSERFTGNSSLHGAHVFRVSTRDLARFGLLYLQEGRWNGRQIVESEWVRESLRGLPTGQRPGELYGYLWWTYDRESEWWSSLPGPVHLAQGNRGHWLVLLPALDLVIAHQVATGGLGLGSQMKRRVFGSPAVGDADLGRLVHQIVAALPAADRGREVAADAIATGDRG